MKFPTILALLALVGATGSRADTPAATAPEPDQMDPLVLEPFVTNARAVENFGFTVARQGKGIFVRRYSPYVVAVYPNTAAAKAGLRPGDRILESDGQSTLDLPSRAAFMWRGFPTPPGKRAEIISGAKVFWRLKVQSADAPQPRTVTLWLPSSRPRWGSPVWSPPTGRSPATVPEAGPLADRARLVLENGIWSKLWGRILTPDYQDQTDYLGYAWRLGRHSFTVTQQRGRTEIVLGVSGDAAAHYLTSPSGILERALCLHKSGIFLTWKETPAADVQEGFKKEVDFWLNGADRVTPRWPLETVPGRDDAEANSVANGSLPAEFLKLPEATAAQQALLAQAFSKLGAAANHWAYTQEIQGANLKTGRGKLLIRVDPSKSEPENCTLLQADGRAPTANEIKAWRENGPGSTLETFGGLPNPYELFRIAEARPFAESSAVLTFELALRAGAEFPTDKFQALVRVNKADASLADLAIRQRESFKVAGPVVLSGAGLEIRFRTLNADDAPQPEFLKIGGSLHALLVVRLSRTMEVTRTDFTRVDPWVGIATRQQLDADAKRELILPMPQ